MKFTHDFREDLETILHEIDHGEPFAFSRFCDGELALIENRQVQSADGWEVPEEPTPFTQALYESLRYEAPGYHLGLACGCNDDGCCKDVQPELLDHISYRHDMDLDHATTSNVFVNGNFERLAEYMSGTKGSEFFLVGPWHAADFRVPLNIVNMRRPMSLVAEVVEKLGAVRRPIIVCAGPATNLIIHDYWRKKTGDWQTIIDMGSAICGHGPHHARRGYHDPSHPNRKKMCRVFPE